MNGYYAVKKKGRFDRVFVLGYFGESVHLVHPGKNDMFSMTVESFNAEYRFLGVAE